LQVVGNFQSGTPCADSSRLLNRPNGGLLFPGLDPKIPLRLIAARAKVLDKVWMRISLEHRTAMIREEIPNLLVDPVGSDP